MNPEKQTPRSSESLSRKQKLLRRAVPLALLVSGGAAVGTELINDSPEAQVSARAMATAHASGEFGGSESDWGHGTAETLIKEAVYEGAVHAYAKIVVNHDNETEVDLAEIVESLPVYDQASDALEMAGYTEVTPDRGDVFDVNVEVVAERNGTKDPTITYVVTGASIKDIENNQQ